MRLLLLTLNLISHVLFNVLSPGHIHFICRGAVVLIGSYFSPGWALFKQVLKPWINVQALYQPEHSVMEIFSFYQRLQMHRETIINEFIPQLTLCLILSIGFLYLCNRVGHFIAQYLIEEHLPRYKTI